MSDRWRLFVAVPIGESLRDALAKQVEHWRDRPELAGLRWTDPAGWHVTLAFLGATDPAEVDRIARAIEETAAATAPMHLGAGGLGAFPSRSHARVVWYGVADPAGRLADLASRLRSNLSLESAPFRGHVTLARSRGAPVDLAAWIASESAPSGAIDVDRLELLRSHLGRGPAQYERLSVASLGAPLHV